MTTTHAAITHSAASHIDFDDEVGLSVLRRPAHTIARLRGELDIATAPALREPLTVLLRLRMPVPLLILDLAEVWFCDAAGLAVLIGTQRRATSLGTTLRLAAARPQVARVLHVTGLDRSLSIYPTVAAALAELAPGARHHGRAAHTRLYPGAVQRAWPGFTRRGGNAAQPYPTAEV
jgi:anti-anti-sigma factor